MDSIHSTQTNLFGPADAQGVSTLQKMTGQQKSAAQAAPQQAPQKTEPDAKSMDMEKLRELVNKTNESMEAQQRRLMFSVNEDTGIKMIQVFDMDTDKLVRQFPPEEYIGVVKQIQQMMPDDSKGFMLKEQA
jgi:flagellar protein FlaG